MASGFASGIVEKAVETFGGLHILVNNAGFTWDNLIHKMTEEQWDKILDIHLKAPFRIIQAAKPYFCDAAKEEISKKKKDTLADILTCEFGNRPGEKSI